MFEKFKKNSAINRLLEERLYEYVVQELRHGGRRDGLWAKAIANSGGIEEKAKSLYIQYRVQSIKDELEISNAMADEQLKNVMKCKRIQSKDPNYSICSACKFEQWVGYSKCQKCGALFTS